MPEACEACEQPDLTGPDRHETATERLDRQWSELLQELRVIQTGIQLLTGFLLTLPFQTRFTLLNDVERYLYLSTVSSAVLATALLQAPVAVARGLFRRRERAETVLVAHRLAVGGMFFLGCALVGVAQLVFGALTSTVVGTMAAVVTGLLLVGLWLVLPIALRHPNGAPR